MNRQQGKHKYRDRKGGKEEGRNERGKEEALNVQGGNREGRKQWSKVH